MDLGQVRIGLALSDGLAISANPLPSLRSVGPRADVEKLIGLIREHEVVRVVVGLPLLMSGEEGLAAAAARRFVERLQRGERGVEVELWDERLTTVQAERLLISADVNRKKRKQVIDGLAAVIILQNYLDARSLEVENGP